MYKGKTIIIGVTGSIAAYKTAGLVSALVKQNADVTVIMTENACNFINPITFETLTGNKCLVDTFDRNFQYNVEHVALAKKARLVLVAPASANVIGKLAHGIADDMLTTTLLACRCPKLLSPAMNMNMYTNPIVQDNLKTLAHYGYEIIQPASGYLACGDTGTGKMPEPETLLAWIQRTIAHEKDLKGRKVLITAGPTREAIDPVRFITNHSTGKMGYALAENCLLRGAEVTLVTGPVTLEPPMFADVVPVVSAAEMAEAVKSRASEQDILIMTAAVADYRPSHPAEEKIKKKDGSSVIELERTEDILAYLGANRRNGQFICGFSMETENLIANSTEKRRRKKADMIVANSLRVQGAGFGTDTNLVTLITEDGARELELMSKKDVAEEIITEIADRTGRRSASEGTVTENAVRMS